MGENLVELLYTTYKLLTETKVGGVAGISAGTGTLAVSVT